MSTRDRSNISFDSSQANTADCNAAYSSSLQVLRIEHSWWFIFWCFGWWGKITRDEFSLFWAFRCSYQRARSADPATLVQLWIEGEITCTPRTSLKWKKKAWNKSSFKRLRFFTSIPRKHTEITIKTDERKENAAFSPSIKFISCSWATN